MRDAYDNIHLLLDEAEGLAILMGYRPQEGSDWREEALPKASRLMERLLAQLRGEVLKLEPILKQGAQNTTE
ncbi:hypothetical protein ACSSZE_05780 [Acidithiobacillus caldus]